MNGHRSKQPELVGLGSTSGSLWIKDNSDIEGGNIVNEMDEHQNLRNRNQNQNEGDRRTTTREHYTPIGSKSFTEIVPPLGENVNFKIDAAFINSLPNFHGLTSENPYMYLEELNGKCFLCNIPRH